MAAPTDAEQAYIDLVFGHCFVGITGKSLVETSPDITTWNKVVDYDGSEASMNKDKSGVDLRSKSIGKASFLVDLKNQEVCWTQGADFDATTAAARLRLMVLDSAYSGMIMQTEIQQGESGNVSRVTTMGLANWDETKVPVIVMREILYPTVSVITTQVMMGEKGPTPAE